MKNIFVISVDRLNEVYPGFGNTLMKHIKPSAGKCLLHNDSINDFYRNQEVNGLYKQILSYFVYGAMHKGYMTVFVVKEELASSALERIFIV